MVIYVSGSHLSTCLSILVVDEFHDCSFLSPTILIHRVLHFKPDSNHLGETPSL